MPVAWRVSRADGAAFNLQTVNKTNDRSQVLKVGELKMKMTLQQANHLIETADKMFRRAALAWERGSNSGNTEGMKRGEKQCEACRARAELMLEPLGIAVDYPGLYPSFTVAGGSYHTTESAVSAALILSAVLKRSTIN